MKGFIAGLMAVAAFASPAAHALSNSEEEALTIVPFSVATMGGIITSLCYASAPGEEGEYQRRLEYLRADAALFVASGGSSEPGAILREVFERVREKNPRGSDLQVAEAVLATEVK